MKMLPTTSKNRLSVQIISTTTLITIILLSSLPAAIESLPITSKPIESTVENLAWEAWLMVPVGQQQKSRKVTPKSIFIVPQKKNQSTGSPCPPGEHFLENRCIPTVTIDTEQILLTQLTNLVLTSGDYDYDYDEEEKIGAGGEKLEGEVDIIPSTNAADEPLKFDIFRDNFPIGSSGSGDSSGVRDDEDANAFFFGERRRRPPTSPETTVPDLETGSSHSYGVQNERDEDDSSSSLFVSGIDAILVPAVSETQAKEQNLSFSIYPVVVNTTSGKTELELLTPLTPNKASSLAQILEGESLMLDQREVAETETTTTERVETTTEMITEETTTMELEKDEDVESKTEFVRSVTEEQETTIPPTEPTETTVLEEDATTTVAPSEETSTTAEPEVVSTTVSPQDDDIIITTTITAAEEAATTLASLETESQTVKSDSMEVEPSPPLIDIAAELKEINRIVAKKRQVTQNRVEDASTAWTKIIPTLSTTASNDVSSESSATTAQELSPTSSTTSPPTVRADPFWWLPTGWRVDQSDEDRPLLLRFLSALSGISGSQTKV